MSIKPGANPATHAIQGGSGGCGAAAKVSPDHDQTRPVSPIPSRKEIRSKSPLPPGVKSPTQIPTLGGGLGLPKKDKEASNSSNKTNHLTPPKQQK